MKLYSDDLLRFSFTFSRFVSFQWHKKQMDYVSPFCVVMTTKCFCTEPSIVLLCSDCWWDCTHTVSFPHSRPCDGCRSRPVAHGQQLTRAVQEVCARVPVSSLTGSSCLRGNLIPCLSILHIFTASHEILAKSNKTCCGSCPKALREQCKSHQCANFNYNLINFIFHLKKCKFCFSDRFVIKWPKVWVILWTLCPFELSLSFRTLHVNRIHNCAL